MIELSTDTIINTLEKNLPPIFTRNQLPKLTGGFLNIGTLANLGNEGPPYKRTKRHALYEKTTFLEWLRKYLV